MEELTKNKDHRRRDTDNQIPIRIDSRTVVFVESLDKVEKAREKYKQILGDNRIPQEERDVLNEAQKEALRERERLRHARNREERKKYTFDE